ncbi:MAG: TonB-dependent receptor [Candidatus Acidiferrum sp.]
MLAKIFSFWAMHPGWVSGTAFLLFSLSPPAYPQAPQSDLAQMNIEDLMKIEVTSVSRHEQSLSQTAAAVFVITEEDILHSGANNIPELLRMVTGVQVAQISASDWAISGRGFNSRFSNKLLVMVDGRTVYNPSFGGVFYDVLDVPLEQIARIEVIRGPGGSIWGTNAVNGVINILTKKASATPGTTVVGGGGSTDRGFGLLQQGGKLRSVGDFRIFAKYSTDGSLRAPDGQLAGDGWHILNGGFRTDSQISSKDTLSVQGDIYSGREGLSTLFVSSLTQPPSAATHAEADLSGGSLQASWNHRYSGRSDTTLIVSYERYARTDALDETRGTLDVDFQHNLSVGERHQFVWGFDYRDSSSQAEGSFAVSMIPSNHDTSIYSGFVQDEIVLAANRLSLTLGVKLEHHYNTGFAAMPSVRMAWTPSTNSTYWAAVSRALRTPADMDTAMDVISDVFLGPGGMPVVVRFIGNPQVQNESLLAYEAGYRTLLRKNLSLDLAAYYNSYADLQTLKPSAPFLENSPAPLHLVMPLIPQNIMDAESHGLEVFANWRLLPRWTFSPGYAFERIHAHLDPGSPASQGIADAEGYTPVHSAQLRSRVALPREFSWDTSVYFVNRLVSPPVAAYTRLDSGLTWQWKEHLSLSLYGQNLLQDQHLEFRDFMDTINSSLMKRGAYVKFTWHF